MFKKLFKYSVLSKIFLGLFLDFGPVLIFLFTANHFNFYKATFILMLTTLISTLFTFIKQKRIPFFAVYITLLTIFFGFITISHHDPHFIEMRDTIYDLTLALTLVVGLLFDKLLLKLALESFIKIHDRTWLKLTYTWIAFFVLNSLGNEYVRRFFSKEVWVHFKIDMMSFTIIFAIVTFLLFYELEEE